MAFKGVINSINEAAQKKGFELDANQINTLNYLDPLVERLVQYEDSSRFFDWFRRAQKMSGVYIWGGVGRGKSFLVDSFFESVPISKKRRVHYHHFMVGIHQELKNLQGKRNPLSVIARKMQHSINLLCIDEFQVSDIGDAMIMQNLLNAFFTLPIVLVTTSNTHPDDLYKSGLQRERFLPAIDLINANMNVVQLDGGADYRFAALSHAGVYHSPHSERSKKNLRIAFERLAGVDGEAKTLMIKNRPVKTEREANGVVWFSFKEICGGPRGQADFILVAKEYHTVIISKIPIFTLENVDQKRRFTWLIDELYDQGVNIIVSAEGLIHELFENSIRDSETLRTESRLVEMQSKKYLSLAHGKQTKKRISERNPKPDQN
ncbi:MAG: cell division protein ZapE [Proteobacteria bacterium]|nr:cell division protein ZapE [Pseudomonadota bacterium]